MEKLKFETLPRFNLSALYVGDDDPQLKKDTFKMEALYKKFAAFEGRLNECLDQALETLIEARQYAEQLQGYFYLRTSQLMTDSEVLSKNSTILEKCQELEAKYATYFDLEISEMKDKWLEEWYVQSDVVRKHKPFIEKMRSRKPYLLSKEVEAAIASRKAFSTPEWSTLWRKMTASMTVPVDGKLLSLMQANSCLMRDKDAQKRNAVLKALNNALKDQVAPVAQTVMNNIIGLKNQEDKDRGYAHPMASRNLSNMVGDTVVESLISSTLNYSQAQSKRYYALKAALMGTQLPLSWADRLAPLPFSSEKEVSWEEAVNIVGAVHEGFHEDFGKWYWHMVQQGHVDVPSVQGKRGGAYNYGLVKGDGDVESYILLNYEGSWRDVSTWAHESGHGVHSYLGKGEQGVLMGQAPMCYAETASIFTEMLTFDVLYQQEEDDREKLNMLVKNLDDFFACVMRQISFCVFEQQVHEARKKGALSVQDYCDFWIATTKRFFGEDGDIFNYDNMAYMWAYITHFTTPFYVYAYAFGALFSQSLFAVKDQYDPDIFADMFVEMLKKGGTEDAVALMKPFGLDPTQPNFWNNAFEFSLVAKLDEAEALAKKLGYL